MGELLLKMEEMCDIKISLGGGKVNMPYAAKSPSGIWHTAFSDAAVGGILVHYQQYAKPAPSADLTSGENWDKLQNRWYPCEMLLNLALPDGWQTD